MLCHHLTPRFILQQIQAGHTRGSFEASALFVDLSGFTPLTAALMRHGTEGAEVLAEVLVKIFEPLIEIVYTQGGFIGGFAGDAFKALFPDNNCQLSAVRAAWQISNYMRTHNVQQTRFGQFEFNLKACVGYGMVDWGIWQGDPVPDSQYATYFFAGDAIDRALTLDEPTQAGQVSITQEVYQSLERGTIDAIIHPQHVQVTGMPTVNENAKPANASESHAPADHDAVRQAFYPRHLLESTLKGEFRQVVTIFVNLQSTPNPDVALESLVRKRRCI